VFPVRRLIRRDPEIFPVLWQQALRLERLIVPAGLRRAGGRQNDPAERIS